MDDKKSTRGASKRRSRETAASTSERESTERPVARRIRYYGDPVLKTPAREIEVITPAVLSFVGDMIATLMNADGLGLAAQQVGEPLAVAVLNLKGFDDVEDDLLSTGEMLVLLNPDIAEQEGHQTDEEGCLSFPGLYVQLTRPERVVVVAQRLIDENAVPVEIEARGLFARAICHEIDHLQGRLIIDRLSPFARVRALAQWRLKLAEALRNSEDKE
ncbi:MAG: peptide deformylase [candidate division WOR-3 bacterium]